MSRPPQFLNQHSSVSHSWHHNRVFIPSLSSSPLSSPCHFLIPSHCWSLSSIFWILQQSNKLEDICEFCHSLEILRNIYKYRGRNKTFSHLWKMCKCRLIETLDCMGRLTTAGSLIMKLHIIVTCYNRWELHKHKSRRNENFINESHIHSTEPAS